MMTMPAKSLQAGDRFTDDDGESWVTVKAVREADRGRKVVVIDAGGWQHIFHHEHEVVVEV